MFYLILVLPLSGTPKKKGRVSSFFFVYPWANTRTHQKVMVYVCSITYQGSRQEKSTNFHLYTGHSGD